ncbi:MAG: urease accessory protein UreD [Hyphomicrobiaceae bacterium]
MNASEATSRSEAAKPGPAMRDVRVRGGVSIRAGLRNGLNCVTHVAESDGYKARVVRRANPPEVILINTGGGLAAGDHVHQSFAVEEAASLTVTTMASERCYRSGDGDTARVSVEADIGAGAAFNWLPQETILFDSARLDRSLEIDLAPTGRLLLAETVVFGRRAMGEFLTGGMFADRWRVRRDGRLVFAENVHLTGDAFDIMTQPAMAGGSHAALTLLLAAPDAENWLGSARSVLEQSPFECAASAWDKKLVVRGLAHRCEDVRHLMQSLIPALGGPALPRAWLT